MSFKDKTFKNQSPWGSNPGGGSDGRSGGNGSGARNDPPNIDDIIKNLQKIIKKIFWRQAYCIRINNFSSPLGSQWSL